MSSPEKEEYLVIEKGAAGDESSAQLGQRVVGEQVVINEDGSRTVIRTVEETFEEEVEEEFNSSASSATSTDSSPAIRARGGPMRIYIKRGFRLFGSPDRGKQKIKRKVKRTKLRTESYTERNEGEDGDSGIENATPAKSPRIADKDPIKGYVTQKMLENHPTDEPPQPRNQHSPIIGRTGKLYKRKQKEPCPYCEYTRQVLTMMGHDMEETEKLVLNVGKVKECLIQEMANIEERQRILKQRIIHEEHQMKQRRLQEQYQKLKKLKKRKRRQRVKPVEQPPPKKAVAIAMRVGPEQTENKQVGLYRLYKPPLPMTARPSMKENHPIHHEVDVSKRNGPKCRSSHHTDLYPEDDGRYHCHGDVKIHRGDMYYTIPAKDLLFRSYAQEKEVDPITIERIMDKIPQLRRQQGDHVIVLDEDILTFGNWEEVKSEVIIPHNVLRMDEAPVVPLEREGRVSPITLEMGTWDEVLDDVFHIAIDKEVESKHPRYQQGQNRNAWTAVEEADEVPKLQYQASQIHVVEQEVFKPETEEIEVEEAEYLNGVLRSIYTNLEHVNGEFPGYCDSCAHAKLHEVMQEVFEAEMSQVVFEQPEYLEGEEGKTHVKLEEAKEELPPLPFHMLAYGQAIMDMYRPNAKKVRSESPRYLHSVEDLEFLHEEDYNEDSERMELERLMGEQVKQVLWKHNTGQLRSSSPEYLNAVVSEGYVSSESEDGQLSPAPSLQSLVIGETLMDIFRAEAGAVQTQDPRYHHGIMLKEYTAEEEIDSVLGSEHFDKAAVELLRQDSFRTQSGVRRSEHARFFAKENQADLQEESTGKFSPVSFENALLGQVFVDQWKADLQTIEAETARYHHGIVQHEIVGGESVDGKVSPPPHLQNVVVGQALMDIFKANVEEVPLERPRHLATENELTQESTGKISPVTFEAADYMEVLMKKRQAITKQQEVRTPRYHHGVWDDEYIGHEEIDGRISPKPTAEKLQAAKVLMETFKATSDQVRPEIPRHFAKEGQMEEEGSTGTISPVSFENVTFGEVFMEKWRTNLDQAKTQTPRYHHAFISDEFVGEEDIDGRISPKPTLENLLTAHVLMETFKVTSDQVRPEIPRHFAKEGQMEEEGSTGTISPVSFENVTFGEVFMEKWRTNLDQAKTQTPRYHHAFISDEFVGEENIDGRISPKPTLENLLTAQVLMETFKATSEQVRPEVPRYMAKEGQMSEREESAGRFSPVSYESANLGEIFMEKWRTNIDLVKASSPRYHQAVVADEFIGREEIDGRLSPKPSLENLLSAQVLMETFWATSDQVRAEVPCHFATEGQTSEESTGKISPVFFENADFGDIFVEKFKAVTKQEKARVPRYHHGYVTDEFIGEEEIDGRISPRPTLENLLTAKVLMETFKATSEQVRPEIPRYMAKEGQMSEREESTGKLSPVSFESAHLGEIFMEKWRTNVDLIKANSPRYHQAVVADEFVGEEETDGRLSPEPTLENLLSAQALMETFRAKSGQVRTEVPCHFATEGLSSFSSESARAISPVSFENVKLGEVFLEEWKANIDKVKAQTPRYHHGVTSNEFVGEEDVDGRVSPVPTFENLVTAKVLMETFRAASKEVREEVPRHVALEGQLSMEDLSTGKVTPLSFERAALGETLMQKWSTELKLVKASSPRYLQGVISDEYVGEEKIDGRLSPEPSYHNLVAAQTLMETFKATTEKIRAQAPRHYATEGQTSLNEESTGKISPVTLEGAVIGEILLRKMSADLSRVESQKPRYHQGVVSNEYVGYEGIDGKLSPVPSPDKVMLGEAFMETFRATANEVREEVPQHWAREGNISLLEEQTGRVSPVAFEAANFGHIFMEKWKANLEKIKPEEARYHQAMVMEQLLWEEKTEGEILPNPSLQNLVLGQALMDTFRATEHHVKVRSPEYKATENHASLEEGYTGRISPLSFESAEFGEIFLDKWKASLEQVIAEAPRFHQAIVKDQFVPEGKTGGELSRSPSFRKADVDQVEMNTYRANAMKVRAQLPQYQAIINHTLLEEGTTGKVSPVSFEAVTFGEILMEKWQASLERVLTESPRYNQAIMKDQYIPEDRTDGVLSRTPSFRKADVGQIPADTYRANAEKVRAQAPQYQATENHEMIEEGVTGKVSPVSFNSVRYGQIIMEKSRANLEQVQAESARYHQAIVKDQYIPEDCTDGKLSRAPSFRKATVSKTTMDTLRAAAERVKAQAPQHKATVNKSDAREESTGRISPVSFQSLVLGQVMLEKWKANLECVETEKPRYKQAIQKSQFLAEGHATATQPLPNFSSPVFQPVQQDLHQHQTSLKSSEKPQYLQVQEQEATLHVEQEGEVPPLTFQRSVHGQVMQDMFRARHEELDLEMPRYHQPVQRQVHVHYEEVEEEIPAVNIEAVEYAPVQQEVFEAALDMVRPDMDVIEAELKKANSHPETYEDLPGISTETAKQVQVEEADIGNANEGVQRSESPAYLSSIQNTAFVHESDVDDNISVVEFDSTESQLIPAERVQTIYVNSPTVAHKPFHKAEEVELEELKETKELNLPEVEVHKAKPSVALGQLTKAQANTPKVEEPIEQTQMQKIEPVRQMRSQAPVNRAPQFRLKEQVMEVPLEQTDDLPKILKKAAKLGLIPKLPKNTLSAEEIQSLKMDVKFAQELQEELREEDTSDVSELDMDMADLGYIDQAQFRTADVFAAKLLQLKVPKLEFYEERKDEVMLEEAFDLSPLVMTSAGEKQTPKELFLKVTAEEIVEEDPEMTIDLPAVAQPLDKATQLVIEEEQKHEVALTETGTEQSLHKAREGIIEIREQGYRKVAPFETQVAHVQSEPDEVFQQAQINEMVEIWMHAAPPKLNLGREGTLNVVESQATDIEPLEPATASQSTEDVQMQEAKVATSMIMNQGHEGVTSLKEEAVPLVPPLPKSRTVESSVVPTDPMQTAAAGQVETELGLNAADETILNMLSMEVIADLSPLPTEMAQGFDIPLEVYQKITQQVQDQTFLYVPPPNFVTGDEGTIQTIEEEVQTIPNQPQETVAKQSLEPEEHWEQVLLQWVKTELQPHYAEEIVLDTKQVSSQEIPPTPSGDSASVASIPSEAMETAQTQHFRTELHPHFADEKVIDAKQEFVYLYTIVPQQTTAAESSEVPVLRLQKVRADEFKSMLHPHFAEEGSIDERHEYVYFIPPGVPQGAARIIRVPSAQLSQARVESSQTELRPHYGREADIQEEPGEGVTEFDGPQPSVARGDAVPHEYYQNVVPSPQTQTWVHVPPPKMRHAKDSSIQTRDEVVYTIPPIPLSDRKVVPVQKAQQGRILKQVIPTQAREIRMEIPEERVYGIPGGAPEQSAIERHAEPHTYQKVVPKVQTWIQVERPKMVTGREGVISDVVAEVVSAVAPIPTQAASEGIVPAEVMAKVHAAQLRTESMPREGSMHEQVEIISTIPPLSSKSAIESLTPAGVFRQIHAQHVQSHKVHAGKETILRDSVEIQREVPPLMPKTTMWRLLPQDKTPTVHQQQRDSHRAYSAGESHVAKSRLESVTELPDVRPKVAREVLTHEEIHQAITKMQRSYKLKDQACEIQEAVAQLVENSDGSVAFIEGENLPSMPECPFCDVQEGMIHFGPSYELKKLQTTQVFQVGEGPQLRNIYVRQVQDARGKAPLEETRSILPTQRQVASTGTVISDEYQRANVDTLYSNWVPAELQVVGELEALMQQGIIRYNPLHSFVEEEEEDVYDYGDVYQSVQKSGHRRAQREGATVGSIPNVGYPTKQWSSARNMTKGQIEREGDESLDSELIMELTAGGLHQEKIVQKDGWTYIYIPGPPESPKRTSTRTTTKISYREDRPPFAFDFSRLMHWTVGRQSEVEKKARVPEQPHYIPFDFTRVATWTVHEYQPGSSTPAEKTYVSAALPVQVRNTYFVKSSPARREDVVQQSPRISVPQEVRSPVIQQARSVPQETVDWNVKPSPKDFDFSRVQNWTVTKKETVGGNSAVGPDEMRISYIEDGKLKQRYYRRPSPPGGSSVMVGQDAPDLTNLKFIRADEIPLPQQEGRVQHSSAVLPGEMYITYVENGEVKKLYMSKNGQREMPGEVVNATSRQAYFQPGSTSVIEDDDKASSISGISGVGRPARQFPSTNYEREGSAAKPPSPTDELDTPKTLEMTSGSRHEPSTSPDIHWTYADRTQETAPPPREDSRPSQLIVKSGSRPSTPAGSVGSRRSDRVITYKYDDRKSDDVSLRVLDGSRASSHSSTAVPTYATPSHTRPKSPTPNGMAHPSPPTVSQPPPQPASPSPVAPPRRRRSSSSSTSSTPPASKPHPARSPAVVPSTPGPVIAQSPEPMDTSPPAVSGQYVNSYPERDYSRDHEQPLTIADHDIQEDALGKPKKVGKLKASRFFPFLRSDKKGKKTKGPVELAEPVGVIAPTRENRERLEKALMLSSTEKWH